MNHALFIANYIIEYSNSKGYEINNLKLQKLLYFINVRNIVENGAPLFEESMEKWKYGPVIPEVYHEYKRFGAFSISSDDIITEYIEFDTSLDDTIIDFNIIDYDSKKVQNKKEIESVIDKLADYTPFELVEITHKHAPWLLAEDRIMQGIKGIKYTVEEIKDYFQENPEEKIWAQSK